MYYSILFSTPYIIYSFHILSSACVTLQELQ